MINILSSVIEVLGVIFHNNLERIFASIEIRTAINFLP